MKPLFVHNVFFSLKDPHAERIAALVAACHEYLATIPGLLFYAAGTLSDVARPVSDRDYDVALHTVFASQQAHDAYQTHPRHLEFVAQQKAYWSKVRVFDSNCQGGALA